jgi:hypothetical protein
VAASKKMTALRLSKRARSTAALRHSIKNDVDWIEAPTVARGLLAAGLAERVAVTAARTRSLIWILRPDATHSGVVTPMDIDRYVW